MGDVVGRVALPALIFQGLTGAPLGETVNPAFLTGYATGSLLVFGGALGLFLKAWGMTLAEEASLAIGTASSNSALMGYPIALALLGPQAATVLAQCLIIENLLVIPLALILAGVRARARRRRRCAAPLQGWCGAR